MSAFLGAIGFIGLIVGIVLMIVGWIKKKKYKGGLIALVSLILFIIAVATTPNNEKPITEKASGEPAVQNKKEDVTWEEKVKEVAAKDATETEKFDEISLYAKDYKPTKDEIKEFENYIIQEYKDKKYIMDISNHEYMLGNIFKSQVVEQYYDEGEPMKDFAFDFWQNSKYNYRGVENMTSEATLSNEEQMDKALAEMGR
jgi:hypothetical protein